MGVKGLMSYMLNDGSSFKPHKLRQSKVIIDGNNFLHSIHHAHNVCWKFGGEYDSYDKALVKFFQRLRLCEIEPIIVFDGCYDAEGSKIKTTISRFKDRIKTCSRMNKSYLSEGYLLPMLTLQTMISVLQRLNIDFITCHEEADKEAAALANYFHCPVISNDSDFFIFPLNFGFIPVGSLNFIPVEEPCQCCLSSSTHFYMSCAIFNQSNLCLKSKNNLPIKRTLMPLFSTLMGNDFLSIDFFEIIFLQNNSKNNSKKYSKTSSKLTQLLNWVHEFDNIDSAIDKVISLVKEKERVRVEHTIRSSIEQYNLDKSNLIEPSKSNLPVFLKTNDLFNNLPEFIDLLLRKSILSPILVNSLVSGRVFLSSNVESIKLDSIHCISDKIRNRFYNTLFRLANKSSGFVIEYTRKEAHLYKTRIDIDEISMENSNNNICDFPLIIDRISFIKIMILYWVEEKSKRIQNLDFHSVLATIASVFIQFSWKIELLKSESFNKTKYENRIYKFFTDPIVTNVNKFQIDLIHNFNELQSIYFSLVQLLCLDSDFNIDSIPSPQSLFCGKLNYNLSVNLKKRKTNCWDYIWQLFESVPCKEFQIQFSDIICSVGKIIPNFDLFITSFKNCKI